MNSSPTRYRCWLTTPSFCNPKRNPMTPLEQKLLEQERFPGARISDENQVGAVGNKAALLICDELGYLALDQQSSNLFYQVISTRHSQKRSTIITTNTPFSDWGNILFNTTIATAIADRLVENSEIFLLGGDSLRKANKTPDPPAE